MDSYPDDYVVHNLPLVILAGLEANDTAETPFVEKSFQFLGDGGFRLRAELPPLHHPLTADLRAALLAHDQSNAPWRSRSADKTDQGHTFKIRSVGRTYTFPPRKAPPPPHAPRLGPTHDNGVSPPPLTLHSTLSPLSPSSPLYPDGIITSLWITKHQYRLPSVLVSFYNLISDSGTSSLEDNRIKNEVNSVRSLISSTSYKTRFVIVLVADGYIDHVDLEERLVNIRRGTNFDSKALYFLPSTSTAADLGEFAKVLFNTIYPSAIDYYRDLSKHARRKRSRNTIPQPTITPGQGSSVVLSTRGWNVRYEFKLGIFAETRQELEAASRNYEQAYEGLFDADLFENIAFRSPRFNEARMLADIIAIRLMRCALWSSKTAVAVSWWLKHRDRMHDFLGRREAGTKNYSWEAWQTIWSRVMAELVSRANIFSAAQTHLPAGSALPVQILSERVTAAIDRSSPWEALHHEGYWLNIAINHIKTRRSLMQQISEDVLEQPEQASSTYLAPGQDIEKSLLRDEGDSYARRIRNVIDDARHHFGERDQHRMIEQLQYRAAKEQSDPSEAVSILTHLWQRSHWRKSGWWQLLAHVGHDLAMVVPQHDAETVMLLMWELARISTTGDSSPRMLDSVSATVALDHSTTLSNVVPTVAFACETGHVGQALGMQLTLTHRTSSLTVEFAVAEIKIAFDGSISPILITFEDEAGDSAQDQSEIVQLRLTETNDLVSSSKRQSLNMNTCWKGTHSRTRRQQCDIFNFEVVPREAGQVTIASVMILMRRRNQEITLNNTDLLALDAVWWELSHGRAVPRAFGLNRDVTTTQILPKPPKAEIKVLNQESAYYTDEMINLLIEVFNDEDEMFSGKMTASSLTPDDIPLELQWQATATGGQTISMESDANVPAVVDLKGMAPKNSQKCQLFLSNLLLSTTIELRLEVQYHLQSDPSHVLSKMEIVELVVIKPFEASAVFQPRLHTEPWPDFFSAQHALSSDEPNGLKQWYLVKAQIGCFTHNPVSIRGLSLSGRRIIGGAICEDCKGRRITLSGIAEHELHPNTTTDFVFDLEIQKLLLGDRAPVASDFVIEVDWSRLGSDIVNKTSLAMPRFIVPMSEPRVLLGIEATDVQSKTYQLTYTIENPSMHFLTFNISMDGGDGIAFSGPKSRSISLVPVSRYEIQYRALMQKNKEWVDVHLDVIDAFFGQTLKVQPASEGLRVNKQGQIQVWSGD